MRVTEPDGDGKPIAIGEEITVKVDTAALAQRHDDARREHLLFNLRRELQLLSGRIKRAELLVLEAQRRTGALARDQRKN